LSLWHRRQTSKPKKIAPNRAIFFSFFLLYLKKVKVFHNFSCVFEKNVVPLQRILIEGIQCREKSYIVGF